MPALEGRFLKEISVKFAGESHAQNTEKHKTKLCAEVPERPLPKDPFFSAADYTCNDFEGGWYCMFVLCVPLTSCEVFQGLQTCGLDFNSLPFSYD